MLGRTTPHPSKASRRLRRGLVALAVFAALLVGAASWLLWTTFHPADITNPARYASELAAWPAARVTHFPPESLAKTSKPQFLFRPGPLQAAAVMALHLTLNEADFALELARVQLLAQTAPGKLLPHDSPEHWLPHFGSTSRPAEPEAVLVILRSDHEDIAWVWALPTTREVLYFVTLQ